MAIQRSKLQKARGKFLDYIFQLNKEGKISDSEYERIGELGFYYGVAMMEDYKEGMSESVKRMFNKTKSRG